MVNKIIPCKPASQNAQVPINTLVDMYYRLAVAFQSTCPEASNEDAAWHVRNAAEHMSCVDSPAYDLGATKYAIGSLSRLILSIVGEG